tara:strand:+ start:665 stop:2461 length:1797 start_codon:yes stop_codon:yes gene_type:complete
MADEQKKIIPINYTSREFETIREDLLQVAERLYPDSFQDFSEASFASLMVDAVAYVGDQLSFYLDYNVNESFLDTAYQFNNVLRHGRVLGYKHTGRPSTYGSVAIYTLIPASATGIGPDRDYIPILKRGTQFSTSDGLNFSLTENVDFSDPKNPIVVARVNETTGAPTFYAIKAYGTVVSGLFASERITVGSYERFKRLALATPNVSEIISVFDTEGNEYFEVDYLAQDIVYKEVTNNNYKNDNVASIIKPYLVSRKFVVEREADAAFLQFGSGKANDSDVVANPQSVAMDIHGKTYTTSLTFDPTQLSKNESFGIVPSDTTLIVTLRTTNPTNSNVSAGELNTVVSSFLEFENRSNLTNSTISSIRNSIEVSNESPITGDTRMPNSNEIKQRIFDTFPTQNRAVTQADYENVAYRMPAKFGSIKRVSVQRDPDSQKRNLNMYVISEDKFGKLIATNTAIKNNLKIWLNQYRMISDTIDILDPYIINLGIDFSIRTTSGADKFGTIDNCISKLTEFYKNGFFIGETVLISDIYNELKNVRGVLDVLKVNFRIKSDSNYSGVTIDINKNLSPDGNELIIPKNAIVEIKYPATDIRGKAK